MSKPKRWGVTYGLCKLCSIKCDFFRSRKGGGNVYHPYCRTCVKTALPDRNFRKLPLYVDGILSYECVMCHNVRPLTFEYFNNNKKTSTGFQTYCRECVKHKYKAMEPLKKHYIQLKKVERSRAVRLDVLSVYSNGTMKCACCGESELKFLCLDHIHGGGSKHRKEVGSGFALYLWLKRSGYPKGYQVLCHNCNMAKGFYGLCPHKEAA